MPERGFDVDREKGIDYPGAGGNEEGMNEDTGCWRAGA